MAIDLQETRNNLYKISMGVSRMLSLVDVVITGNRNIEGVEINFPDDKKKELISKYQELKTEIQQIWIRLP